jgi:hypothetical protein
MLGRGGKKEKFHFCCNIHPAPAQTSIELISSCTILQRNCVLSDTEKSASKLIASESNKKFFNLIHMRAFKIQFCGVTQKLFAYSLTVEIN